MEIFSKKIYPQDISPEVTNFFQLYLSTKKIYFSTKKIYLKHKKIYLLWSKIYPQLHFHEIASNCAPSTVQILFGELFKFTFKTLLPQEFNTTLSGANFSSNKMQKSVSRFQTTSDISSELKDISPLSKDISSN